MRETRITRTSVRATFVCCVRIDWWPILNWWTHLNYKNRKIQFFRLHTAEPNENSRSLTHSTRPPNDAIRNTHTIRFAHNTHTHTYAAMGIFDRAQSCDIDVCEQEFRVENGKRMSPICPTWMWTNEFDNTHTACVGRTEESLAVTRVWVLSSVCVSACDRERQWIRGNGECLCMFGRFEFSFGQPCCVCIFAFGECNAAASSWLCKISTVEHELKSPPIKDRNIIFSQKNCVSVQFIVFLSIQ